MIGIGVLGTGKWGKNHVRVYKELKDEGCIDSLVICDTDENTVKQLAKTHDVEYVTDWARLRDDPRIQAVSIATPSKTHFSLAKEFMAAGKDVLVEKPMTMDVREAKELVLTATERARVLMVGHVFRFHPAIQALRQRIERGELGTIKLLITNRLFFGAPRKDMGVIYALGIHDLDLYCYLLDRELPNSVIATSSSILGADIEETAALVLDFGDVMGFALESWMVPAYGKKRDLAVIGTETCAYIDYLDTTKMTLFETRISSDPTFSVQPADQTRQISLNSAEPLKEELKHFIDCVENRKEPLSNGQVGWRSVMMVEKALESSRTGKKLTFAVNEGHFST
jgi:predicted dehydrogenase